MDRLCSALSLLIVAVAGWGCVARACPVGQESRGGKCVKTPPCEGGLVLYGGDCGDNFDQPLADWTPDEQDGGAQDAAAGTASDAPDAATEDAGTSASTPQGG